MSCFYIMDSGTGIDVYRVLVAFVELSVELLVDMCTHILHNFVMLSVCRAATVRTLPRYEWPEGGKLGLSDVSRGGEK